MKSFVLIDVADFSECLGPFTELAAYEGPAYVENFCCTPTETFVALLGDRRRGTVCEVLRAERDRILYTKI